MSEGQSDNSLSGAIIGGIIGGVIGVVVLILNIVILFIWTMWFRENSKHTKDYYLHSYIDIAISIATRSHLLT